jgi:predicted transcriptional regulator
MILTNRCRLNTIEARGIRMAKTITVRLEDSMYDIFKKAAEGQKRTISNYLEYAALNFTVNESIVDDEEMKDILTFEKDLKKGLKDISAGRYKVIA